jgi:hypothetical protein
MSPFTKFLLIILMLLTANSYALEESPSLQSVEKSIAEEKKLAAEG